MKGGVILSITNKNLLAIVGSAFLLSGCIDMSSPVDVLKTEEENGLLLQKETELNAELVEEILGVNADSGERFE